MEKSIIDYYRIDSIETNDEEKSNDNSVDSADNSKSTTNIKKEPQIVEPLECGGITKLI